MENNTISRELIGATATPFILAVLNEGDSYGYRIIKRIEQLSGGKLRWKDGSLYPVLKRLESQGLIESYWNTEGPRPRRYFRLLPPGEAELKKEYSNWQLLDTIMYQLCKPLLNSM